MQLNELRDPNDEVEQGDKVVTSHVSAKFHKGILIGYVNEVATDANNLTKSGSLTPAVDFEHLSTVLVITDLKQQIDVDKTEEAAEETAGEAQPVEEEAASGGEEEQPLEGEAAIGGEEAQPE